MSNIFTDLHAFRYAAIHVAVFQTLVRVHASTLHI